MLVQANATGQFAAAGLLERATLPGYTGLCGALDHTGPTSPVLLNSHGVLLERPPSNKSQGNGPYSNIAASYIFCRSRLNMRLAVAPGGSL